MPLVDSVEAESGDRKCSRRGRSILSAARSGVSGQVGPAMLPRLGRLVCSQRPQYEQIFQSAPDDL